MPNSRSQMIWICGNVLYISTNEPEYEWLAFSLSTGYSQVSDPDLLWWSSGRSAQVVGIVLGSICIYDVIVLTSPPYHHFCYCTADPGLLFKVKAIP